MSASNIVQYGPASTLLKSATTIPERGPDGIRTTVRSTASQCQGTPRRPPSHPRELPTRRHADIWPTRPGSTSQTAAARSTAGAGGSARRLGEAGVELVV